MNKSLTLLLTLLIAATLGFGIANANYIESAFALILPSASPSAAPGSNLTATNTTEPTMVASPTATMVPTQTLPPTLTPNPLPMVVSLIVSEPTSINYGPYIFPSTINPLTGLAIEDFTLLDRRPIAVKITNYPRSVRPQAGLSKADIVYEYHIERGVSRFVAIFYGQEAAKAGPIRSGRFFDEHIFRMYDAIFVFGNADHRIMDYFLTLGNSIVYSFVLEPDRGKSKSCGTNVYEFLCRDRNILSYNNLFTNTAALTEFITNRNGNHRPELGGMTFSQQTPQQGALALNIFMRYSLFTYNKWEYSVERGRYFRFQETIGYADTTIEEYAKHMDALTNEQLAADNVVVLKVPHEYYVKTKTTEIYKIHLVGSGTGYVFRDGFSFPIIWTRPTDDGIINLYTPEGEYFPLKPGETWYQIISEESSLVNNGVDWRFTFIPPEVPDYPIDQYLNPEP